jgi:predicted transposase YdaD
MKGQEEGWVKSREKERLSIARNLLELGRPIEEIAKVTGLEPERIESLTH